MSKIAIVCWSGTGNTEKMASCIAEGINGIGGTTELLLPSAFSAEKLQEYDVVAFGCSAMGAEELEDSEFEPMFASLENALNGKKIALFGSYGWGDGQWMRDWSERCEAVGAEIYDPQGLIICEMPDEAGLETCRALGRNLANW